MSSSCDGDVEQVELIIGTHCCEERESVPHATLALYLTATCVHLTPNASSRSVLCFTELYSTL